MNWLSTWLSRPKVKLALVVNGIYFICLLTPAAPPVRSWLFARPKARPAPRVPPAYAPPAPPPSATAKAALNIAEKYDQLDVYLTNDLTLVKNPVHTLLFSPTFTAKMSDAGQPRSVLLRFVSYSAEQHYTDATPLRISADGVYKWDDTEQTAYNLLRSNVGRHSVTSPANGVYVETVGVDVPYETFLQIIYGGRVVVELGSDAVTLNPEQMAALREMPGALQTVNATPPPGAGRSSHVGGGSVLVKVDPATKPPAKRH